MNPAFEVPKAWQPLLAEILLAPKSHELAAFLAQEEANGVRIYPPANQRFHALELVKPQTVRVVILGQDPYHGVGQAHGLAFSIGQNIAIPPSLRNIFKELRRDLGIVSPVHGNLESWARQGVLLLNTVLSVEGTKAGSHQGKGWEEITDIIIECTATQKNPIIFMLWGAYAQKKTAMIDSKQHLILHAPHPSPLSAHRGFIGCGHFGKANAFLRQRGLEPIMW